MKTVSQRPYQTLTALPVRGQGRHTVTTGKYRCETITNASRVATTDFIDASPH